jgi:hypothetical protein
VAARKPKRMSAQTVDDEDYQLRHERVAGIDVAKDAAVVCLRLPPGPGKTRRTSRTWEVTARVPDIEELAAELVASGVERVSMESTSDYWRIWVRHEAHCLYSPRSGREPEEVFSDLMANQDPKG